MVEGLSGSGLPGAEQASFEDISAPLRDVTFTVVDLETTGGSAKEHGITEIGAVKSRGGEVLGEFQTLVNPGIEVSPFIASLTGISNAMLTTAPRLQAVLPGFLEFLGDSVLVAHNAGFDVSFLKAGCKRLETRWPNPVVVDSARLSRVTLHRDEVRNHKLATLARFFRTSTEPNHRALSDARATVEVLYGLLERAANLGVSHLDDLLQLCSRISPDQRRKRTLADGLPAAPGVYVFRDSQDRALYVGKSKCIRTRVRSYFTAAEQRKRISEMIRIATRVEPIVCSSDLEAQVREIRLIADLQPPYNRRSRRPDRVAYVRLTDEPVPRLAIATKIRPGDAIIGPFASRRAASTAKETLESVFELRTCTKRLSRRTSSSPCIAAELGSCLAPCDRPSALPQYDALIERVREAINTDFSAVFADLLARMIELADHEQYERAAVLRDELRNILSGLVIRESHAALGAIDELVAARAVGSVWEVHVIRHGRLAGTTTIARHDSVPDRLAAVRASAEYVSAPERSLTAATREETQLIRHWLDSPGVRLVSTPTPLNCRTTSPQRLLSRLPQPGPRPHLETLISEPPAEARSNVSGARPGSVPARRGSSSKAPSRIRLLVGPGAR
ncbi:MAG: DEDD exonuclease domain-containing protein [Actinobacteria bacterium]|nr:DEDD exonuclease domain-containing protein [Actinomycetota bacterium]